MGRWNNRRRWAPRRYDNDDHPRRSPPTYYQTKVDPQGTFKILFCLFILAAI